MYSFIAFIFNNIPHSEFYTLSLHDALPISVVSPAASAGLLFGESRGPQHTALAAITSRRNSNARSDPLGSAAAGAPLTRSARIPHSLRNPSGARHPASPHPSA